MPTQETPDARVNRMAPDMPMQVSAQVADQVRALAAAGGLSPFACKNSAVIRRDVTQRDLDTCVRPAFVRDAEKIVHTPAYNRLNGKTQVFCPGSLPTVERFVLDTVKPGDLLLTMGAGGGVMIALVGLS